MFEAEADGLRELKSANALRVPEVQDCGVRNGEAFIALERFTFDRADAATEALLGERLALLHRHTEDRYGWFRNNTIGLTPQANTWCDDWVEFFRRHRIEFQFELARANGYGGELDDAGERLIQRLPQLFTGYEPLASLCHGDLWGGNWGSVDGEPVIYDPAVYYGDRESDIAMTMLFGGFGRPFYEAYERAWPMAPGHEQRMQLYQLYHALNHLNLFGKGYLAQVCRLIRQLV